MTYYFKHCFFTHSTESNLEIADETPRDQSESESTSDESDPDTESSTQLP